MKLYLHCYKCQRDFAEKLKSYRAEGDQASEISVEALRPHEVEVCDSAVYAMDCHRHGKANVILYTQKFEILFQIGLNAIIDGYYREAVGSFFSSLESFQEYFLLALATSNDLNNSFGEVWKHLARRSERQLGAYVATFFFFNGRLPPVLSQNQIEFRNKVIHQGKIPSRQEAIGFGDNVFSVIRPVLSELRQKSNQALEKMDIEFKKKLRKDVENNDFPVFEQSIHLVFGPLWNTDIRNEKINEKLDMLESWRSVNLETSKFKQMFS